MGKSLSFYNLTGGLNTVQDLFTINSSTNRTESPEMVNVEYNKLGGLKTMRGNIQVGQRIYDINNPDIPIKITCGYEYKKGNKIYHIITAIDGRCMMLNNVTNEFETFYQFETKTERHSICKFAKGIIITNGVDEFLYYEYGRNQTLLGTVSGVEGEYTLTGTDTKFTLELHKGDIIEIDNKEYKVTEITDDTHISVLEKQERKFNYPLSTVLTNATYKQAHISIIDAMFTNTSEGNTIEPRPIRGLAINSYKGRLWVGGNDGILYASELGLANSWDVKYGAVAYDNFNEDTSTFTALGIWDKYLIAHKYNGTYIVNANEDNTQNWTVEPYSKMTCFSQQSFISNDVGYFIYDRINQNIYPLLSRSLYSTTYLGKEITAKIQNIFEFINNEKLDNIFVAYYPKKQYLLFYINFLDGNGYSNKCYIFDMLTKSWLYRELPQQITGAYVVDDELFVITEDGYVLKEFYGVTFNGQPIKFSWLSPSYVWGGGTNHTTTKEFRVKCNQDYSNNFFIDTIKNGNRSSVRHRNINTDKDNGINLIWDIGYQKEDFNYLNVPVVIDIYKYKGSDNKDYYSRSNAITNANVPMYYDKNLTQYAGLNQELNTIEISNQYNYDFIEYIPSNAYSWVSKDLKYKCYQSTIDPNIKVWVSLDDKTKGIRNTKKVTRTVQKYWAWKGSSIDNSSYDVDVFWCPKPNFGYIGNDNRTRATSGDKAIRYNISTISYKGDTWLYNGFVYGHTDRPVLKRVRNVRWPQDDIYENKTFTEWNGNINSDNGENVVVSDVTNTSLVCEGITYNRYENDDYGNNNSKPVYITTLEPKVGNNVYSDKYCTNIITTITSIDSNIKLTLSNEEIIYRNIEGDYIYKKPIYKIKEPIELVFVEMLETKIQYDYPEVVKAETLTDTVWANGIGNIATTIGNLWEAIGYVTKRFLLGEQYFETVQYRFYGDTNENSMAIAGFEVDGIELTEVPR